MTQTIEQILTLADIMSMSQCYPDREHFARAVEKAAISSYKAELLKEVGEPVAYFSDEFFSVNTKQNATFNEPLFTSDQLAKAEQQAKELSDSVAQKVAEACSAYMLNKNYNSLEFDRKYSAKEFCAGQKSTVEFLAKMIRSGEWRKFVKEV